MRAAVRRLLFAGVAALLLASYVHAGAMAAERSGPGWSSVEFSLQPLDEGTHTWAVRLDAKGSGSYSEEGQPQQPLNIGQSTLERIRLGAHRAKSGRCESRQKNVARTGEKTIRYISGDRVDSCTFNFSDDSGLMDAAGAFQAIAETMQAGQRLQHDLRFDRLALDADMDTLLNSIKNGGAIEPGNIAPVLQLLVDDDHVIDRVRRKAARLLQDPGSSSAAAALESSAR
jgi:hypothetical protein